MSTSALPTDSERDAFLRCRQKADHQLGWQAPVWLWLTDKAKGAQQDADTAATGVIFGPEGTIKEADKALTTLSQRLQKAGMAQILNKPAPVIFPSAKRTESQSDRFAQWVDAGICGLAFTRCHVQP